MTRSPRVPKPGPVVPSSKIKEVVSKAKFELALPPGFLVTRWEANDFGIDAMVDLSFPIGKGNYEVSGKRFSVQLKARGGKAGADGTFAVEVEVSTLRMWLAANEPTMLARYDSTSRSFSYLWIDESLAGRLTKKEPSWIAHHQVTLRIPRNPLLSPKSRPSLEAYLLAWRQASRLRLRPGEFFGLRDRALGSAKRVSSLVSAINFPTLLASAHQLETQIDHSVYTVAIAGPSRAGKSTLINALLSREISPVGVLPTTGVSLAIVPAPVEKALITFQDGHNESVSATAVALEPFVSQEKNRNNAKGVRFVTVWLVNSALEHGVSLLDVPGLHDPNPGVRAITSTALQSANAMLYVLDASPFLDGGFSLNEYHIRDLYEYGGRFERTFLLLNKADRLPAEKRTELLTYVNRTLEETGVKSLLPSPPLFISASDAWKRRSQNLGGNDDVSALEDSLWEYLLSHNRVGIQVLGKAAVELQACVGQAEQVIEVSLGKAAQAADLQARLAAVQQRIPQFTSSITSEAAAAQQRISRNLQLTRDAILQNLHTGLNAHPAQLPLPARDQIVGYLTAQVRQAVGSAIRDANLELARLRNLANQAVSEMLAQVEGTSLATVVPNAPSVALTEFDAPIPEDLSGPLAAGALSFIVIAAIIDPILGFFVGLLSFLATLLMSAQQRRDAKIQKIMQKASQACSRAFTQANTQVQQAFVVSSQKINNWLEDRFRVFVNDVENQISRLGTSLTSAQRSQLQTIAVQLAAERKELGELADTLRQYMF